MTIFTISILLTFTGCGLGGGGGGGGASEGNPAAVSLTVSPKKIDSGDRMTVTLSLNDIKRNEAPGIIVKILHPSALRYVSESAVFSSSEDLIEDYSPTSAQADESAYLLFFIDTSDIPENNRSAVIQFLLRGRGEVERGVIAVDLDIVNHDNRGVFEPTDPLFTSLVSTEIDIVG